MKYISYKTVGSSSGGEPRWLYNFVDTEEPLPQKGINFEFRTIGRMSKKGILSTMSPEVLPVMLSEVGAFLQFDIGRRLTVAQKAIDRCNRNRGCACFCSLTMMETKCPVVGKHSQELNLLRYIKGWMTRDVEMRDVNSSLQ